MKMDDFSLGTSHGEALASYHLVDIGFMVADHWMTCD